MKHARKSLIALGALALLLTTTGCIAPLVTDIFFVVGPFLL